MSNHESLSSSSPLALLWINAATVPMIAGFAGGTVSTSLLLPLDIVKLRLQVTESANPGRRFRSFRILGGIVKYEGIRGLYQGWTPAVIGSAVSWGGYFYFYEGFKRRLIEYKVSEQQQEQTSLSETRLGNSVPQNASSTAADNSTVALTSLDNFVLACSAGAVMVAMTNPIWLVKTRMQLQMRRASEQHRIQPYANMVDAFRTIVRDEGWLALYKGSGPAMLLTSHGGVQFVVYEYLRKYFHYSRIKREEGKDVGVWNRLELSAGYLAMGAVAKL
jgi:solute carrier family 25 (mitochondrial folate transporter), member 32